jgi:hypothetical protein
LVEHAIAASFKGTGGGTTVAIDVIGIVAGLGGVTDIANNTITADGSAAAIGTSIGVGAIAVVALLSLIRHTVAATL